MKTYVIELPDGQLLAPDRIAYDNEIDEETYGFTLSVARKIVSFMNETHKRTFNIIPLTELN